MDGNYESEALQLVDIDANIVKTYVFPQIFASHISLAPDKKHLFIGFMAERRYHVSVYEKNGN